MIIKNKDQIITELTELLMDLAKEMNQYQTDIYLYYDEETQTATLDTFTNVGGNSWLDDDHYLLYSVRDTYETYFDSFYSFQELADAIGISEDRLKAETIKYFDYEDDEVIGTDYEDFYFEAIDYIKSRPDYMKEIEYAHDDLVEEYRYDYKETAERIFYDFIEEVNRDEKYGY